MNLKDDRRAKFAFREQLLLRGYESVEITRAPADITAVREGQIYYFEVKFTTKDKLYFGAATLTEWEAALAHEERFWFVVAAQQPEGWAFHEYTPAEFMEFSTVPPFKTYFKLAVGGSKDTRIRRLSSGVAVTRERILRMVELYRAFRQGQG